MLYVYERFFLSLEQLYIEIEIHQWQAGKSEFEFELCFINARTAITSITTEKKIIFTVFLVCFFLFHLC